MRLFITGAAGFVGAATVRIAIQEGHEVIAPIRPGSEAPRLAALSGKFTRLDIDLHDANGIRAAILAYKPAAVLHLAWSGVANSARFDSQQISNNLDIGCSLVQAAAEAGVAAFVGVGSQGEYGAGSDMMEGTLPRPTTLYGAAKVASYFLTQQLAAQANIRYAWMRLFSTYGPDDNDGWLIPMLITEMLGGRRPRTTLGTQSWDWLYVDDVARGIIAVAETPTAAGIFNLGSGSAIRVRDVVEMIRDLAAPGMELVFGEIPFRLDQVMFMRADISRLREATGWAPQTAIQAGLAKTVEWYRARAQA